MSVFFGLWCTCTGTLRIYEDILAQHLPALIRIKVICKQIPAFHCFLLARLARVCSPAACQCIFGNLISTGMSIPPEPERPCIEQVPYAKEYLKLSISSPAALENLLEWPLQFNRIRREKYQHEDFEFIEISFNNGAVVASKSPPCHLDEI